MISEDVISRVKELNDIVDVISETVRLKRAGRNYSGLCPFHNEKTPSFSVSSEKQIYKCFGCGEAGNVITFIMKVKNLTFPEAVEYLAKRANIPIDINDNNSKNKKSSYEKAYGLNVEAARFFFGNLKKNRSAMQYLINRGITEKTIRSFGLGFAEDDWTLLLRYLKRKGFTELDMLSAGLVIKSDKGTLYDRFRNRIIFPVFDHRGRVIGFGGRVMDDSKPKYLNSPETVVFKKGINLYGLNFAIKNNPDRYFIIVEGYMDCISLHQHGIKNAVASLGTALTSEQVRLMKRYADKAIIAYDSDLAGQAATLRGLEILKKGGFDVRVLTVPKGKDPDEFIRANGKEAFYTLIKNALPLIDYKLKRVEKNVNFKNQEEVINYVKDSARILAELDPIEMDIYIKKVAEKAHVNEQSIYDLISGENHKDTNKLQNVNIINDIGQKLYLEPAYLKAERNLLKLMLENEEAYKFILKNINNEQLILQSHKKIFDLIVENNSFPLQEKKISIEKNCNDIETSKEWIYIGEIDYKNLTDCDVNQLIIDCIYEIKKYKLEETKKEIMNDIKQLESKGLIEESLKLAKRLIIINEQISKL